MNSKIELILFQIQQKKKIQQLKTHQLPLQHRTRRQIQKVVVLSVLYVTNVDAI